MARMRKVRSLGQGSGTRRCLRAPDERFGGTGLPPSDMAPRTRSRMSSTTRPVPGSEPHLVAGQPVDGPRNNGVRDGVSRKPLELQRIVEAQDGLLGTDPIPVVMRDSLVRRPRSFAQQRTFHGDTWIAGQNCRSTELPVQAEDDPDAISLAEWPKSPRPADPTVDAWMARNPAMQSTCVPIGHGSSARALRVFFAVERVGRCRAHRFGRHGWCSQADCRNDQTTKTWTMPALPCLYCLTHPFAERRHC